tara:strand:- start:5519 stop:6334 length:816 start_codon:yes stop_codon:yes gene_type:complete
MFPRVAITFLVVVGIYIAIDTVSFLLFGPETARKLASPRTGYFGATKEVAVSPGASREAEEWRVFGKYQGDSEPKMKAKALQKSDLKIELLGLFTEVKGGHGSAIIKNNNNEEILVGSGDYLAGGLKVRDILKDGVVVEKEGQVSTLMLIDWPDYIDIEEHSSKVDSMNQESAKAGDPATALSPPSHSRLLEHAGLQPVDPDLPAGYKVGARAEALKEDYGLQDGDIIVSINGYPLGVEADDRLANSSRRQGQAVMTVRRHGRTFTVKIKR